MTKIVIERFSGLQVILPFFDALADRITDPRTRITIEFVKKLRGGTPYYKEVEYLEEEWR